MPQLVKAQGRYEPGRPRPQVARYASLFHDDYATILSVRPGFTDLASIAFADEEKILAAAADADNENLTSVLPEDSSRETLH